MHKYILITLLFFSTIAPVQAADLTPEAEKKLRASVTSALDYYKQAASLETNGSLTHEDISITPKDSFYEVRVPNIVYTQKNTKMNIGTIVINAVPEGADSFMTSMALPRTVEFFKGTKAEPHFTLTIGQQKFAGLWSTTLQAYTKIDANYEDIALIGNKDLDFTLTLEALKATLNLSKDDNGKTWSGPTLAHVKNLSLIGTGKTLKKLSAKVEETMITASYDQIDMAAGQALKNKLLTLAMQEQEPTEEEAQKIAEETLKTATTMFNGQKNAFKSKNITIEIEPQPTEKNPTPEPISFHLDNAHSAYEINDILKEKGTLKIGFGMDNMSVKPLDDVISGIIPTNNNFDITFTDMPMKSLSTLFNDTVSTLISGDMSETPSGDNAVLSSVMMQLPMLLTQTGAKLSIKDTYIKSADLSTLLSGEFKASSIAGSPIPAIGNMTLIVIGVDEALTKYSALLKDPKHKNYQRYLPVLQSAPLFQMMADVDKTASGQSRLTYRLEVTPEGQVLLNGKDTKGVQKLIESQKAK